MKNSIRKRRYQPKSKIDSSNNTFLYNFAFMSVLTEILIGAVLGASICCGFIFSYIIMKGNIFVSTVIFFIIILFALFLVLLFKYIFIMVLLKIKEIDILEKLLRKS